MDRVKTRHLKKEDIRIITEELGHKLIQNNGNELLYVFDKSFKVPKSYINILFRYNNPYFLTRHVKTIEEVLIKTHDTLLNDLQVTVDLNVSAYGVNIKIGGFTKGMGEVVKILMDLYFNNKDNSREEIVNEQIKDEILSNIYLSPYRKTFQGLYKILISHYEYPEDKINIEDIRDYDITQFKASVNIVGNIELNESISIFEMIIGNSKETAKEDKIPQETNKEVELKSNDTENNAVGFFYRMCSPKVLTSNALGRIILELLQEKFFNQLRTQEELGYVVTSNMITVPNTRAYENHVVETYLYFIVQSEKDTSFLKDRIRRFIEESKEFISFLDDSTFEIYQESVVDGLKEKQKNLYDYSEYINELFTFGITDLSFKEKLIETVENVTVEDVKTFDIFSHDPIVVVVNKKDKSF